MFQASSSLSYAVGRLLQAYGGWQCADEGLVHASGGLVHAVEGLVRPAGETTAPAGFDITQWHHYAGVYSPSLAKLAIYVDGVHASSTSVSGAMDADSGQIFIGKDDYTGRFFNGSIDDVRIYDRALSASEIAAL